MLLLSLRMLSLPCLDHSLLNSLSTFIWHLADNHDLICRWFFPRVTPGLVDFDLSSKLGTVKQRVKGSADSTGTGRCRQQNDGPDHDADQIQHRS